MDCPPRKVSERLHLVEKLQPQTQRHRVIRTNRLSNTKHELRTNGTLFFLLTHLDEPDEVQPLERPADLDCPVGHVGGSADQVEVGVELAVDGDAEGELVAVVDDAHAQRLAVLDRVADLLHLGLGSMKENLLALTLSDSG